MTEFTPTYRFWSIDFHITVVQILAIILAIILKKNFKMEDRESNSNILSGKTNDLSVFDVKYVGNDTYLLLLTDAVLHFEMIVAI